VPSQLQADTVVTPPNDPAAVEKALQSDADIGCVILEPTGGHFGAVPIRGEFLKSLREITKKHNRVLIFDEVISGFRVHPGGAQGYYGVTPDMTTMAKILAGGLPGGCVAGRADILEHVEFRPGKPKMKHPGTFNANPLSAAAGCATLEIVSTGEACKQATAVGQALRTGINRKLAEQGSNWVAYGEFSGVKLLPKYDGPRPTGDDFIPYGGDHVKLDGPKDRKLMHAFRCGMLMHGVDLPGYGMWTSAMHSKADIDKTIDAVARTVALLKEEKLA
jgi:glutamate-1-semialdehyde 2,1-aminomutase